MLIFNTFNIINLKEKAYNTNLSIYGFISISFNTKEKNQLFHIKKSKLHITF